MKNYNCSLGSLLDASGKKIIAKLSGYEFPELNNLLKRDFKNFKILTSFEKLYIFHLIIVLFKNGF